MPFRGPPGPAATVANSVPNTQPPKINVVKPFVITVLWAFLQFESQTVSFAIVGEGLVLARIEREFHH